METSTTCCIYARFDVSIWQHVAKQKCHCGVFKLSLPHTCILGFILFTLLPFLHGVQTAGAQRWLQVAVTAQIPEIGQ